MSGHQDFSPQIMRAEQVAKHLGTVITMPTELLFDEDQKFERLKEVYKAEKEKLIEVFGQNALEIHQVGSSAIRGMPGTRTIDIVVILQSWPPTDDESAKMKKIGYENIGMSPHYEDDNWFVKLMGNNDFGDASVHVTEKGNIGMQNMLAFVEYCNAEPEAAEKYKQIKLEASQNVSDFVDYKQEKYKKVQPLIQKACEWKEKQKEA